MSKQPALQQLGEYHQVLLMKARDPAAFTSFYQSVVGSMSRALLRKWRNKTFVEDAIQHAFERFWSDPLSVRATSLRELRSWVQRVAENHIKDRLKVGDEKWAVPLSELDGEGEEGSEVQSFTDRIPDGGPSVEALVEEEERRRQLLSLMKSLGSPCSEILLSYYMEDRELSEVSKRLGFTLDQTKKHKARCLQILKQTAQTAGLVDLFRV